MTAFSSGMHALWLFVFSGISAIVGISVMYYLLGIMVLLIGGLLLSVQPKRFG